MYSLFLTLDCQFIIDHAVDILLDIGFQVILHGRYPFGGNRLGEVMLEVSVLAKIVYARYVLAVELQQQTIREDLIDRRIIAHGIGVLFLFGQHVLAESEIRFVVP